MQRSSRQAQYLGKIWGILLRVFERYSHLTAVELSLVIRQAGSARNDFEKSGVDSQEEDFYQVEGHLEGV